MSEREGFAPPKGDGCPKPEPPPEPPPTAKVVDKRIVISQQVLFERGTAIHPTRRRCDFEGWQARVFRSIRKLNWWKCRSHG